MNAKKNEAYEKIEYFLRNNLDDADFAEYEVALDTLIMETHPVKELRDKVEQCTNSDTWNCKYCKKTETCKALKDPRNFGVPKKPIAYVSKNGVLFKELPPEPMELTALFSEEQFKQELDELLKYKAMYGGLSK